MKIVIATHNVKKADEMLAILRLGLPGMDFVTLADYPGAPEPEETGATYAENAAIKAHSAMEWTREWSLADDAGLEIEALEGAPGLYSKRFGGEDLPFPAKINLILDQLQSVPYEQRQARFQCWVALARPGEEMKLFSATCEGLITQAASGQAGFGYDPIFLYPPLGKAFADLTSVEKHQVSHRGKVLADVIEFVKSQVSVKA